MGIVRFVIMKKAFSPKAGNGKPATNRQSSITNNSALQIRKPRPQEQKKSIAKKAFPQSEPKLDPKIKPGGLERSDREIEPGVVCSWDLAERELRNFDISTRFGPCISLSRKERFERAKRLGLNPPERISQILAAYPEMIEGSIWRIFLLTAQI